MRRSLSVNERPASPGPKQQVPAAGNTREPGQGAESSAVLDALSKLTDELRSLKEEINLMKSSLDKCGDMGFENKTKLEAIDSKLEVQSKLFEELKAENLTLRNRVTELEVSLNHAEQDLRSRSVEIRGVPVRGSELPAGVVTNIAASLGLQLAPADLDIVERYRAKNGVTRPPPIIAKFVLQSVMDEIVRLKKVKRSLTTRDIGWTDGGAHAIYLGVNMSPTNRRLYWMARQRRAAGKLKYVWFADGRVRVRQADGRPVNTINMPAVLDMFG